MKTYLYSVIDEFGQMGKLPEKIDYSKAPILLYDAPKINRITNDETALWQEPKPKIDQYAAYQTEISTANSVLEIENIVREIKKDTIPDWQKNKLEKIAIEKSKTFDF
jgi:hypothetical protein